MTGSAVCSIQCLPGQGVVVRPGRRTRRCRTVRSAAGFSLLELIVALTLVMLMAVGLFGAFRISVRSWSRGTEFIDVNQRNRTILDLVKKQMAGIYALTAPVDPQVPGPPYLIFAGAETSVQFISLNSIRFQDNPGLTMVSYDLARDRIGNYSLLEREARYIGLDPAKENMFDSRDEQVVTIFADLESLSFEYFDPGSPDRPGRWLKEWDAREAGRLPVAISMTMTARDSRGGTLNRHLVVPIMAKPYDPRLPFANPFDPSRRRLNEDDPRFNR